jgi:hypothetical protein
MGRHGKGWDETRGKISNGMIHVLMYELFFQWPFQEPIDWRYLPYVRPIFDAYVRGYPHNSYGLQNGTNVPPF